MATTSRSSATERRQAGFDYIRPEQPDLGRNGSSAALADEDLNDLAFAHEWGFGLTTVQNFQPAFPDGVSIDQPDPLADVPADVRQAYDKALNGADGCRDAGSSILGYGRDEFFDKADQVRAIKDQFATSDDVIEHYAEWSSCMSDRGYDFASPLEAQRSIEQSLREALDDGREQWVDTHLRAHEIALGTATAECGGPVRDLLDPELSDVWVEYAQPLL